MDRTRKLLPAVFGSVVIMIGTGGCDTTPTGLDSTDRVVVEAFLFANEAITEVFVGGTFALGGDPDSAAVINDADVRLVKNGVPYTLDAVGDSGRYEYRGRDLVVEEGDVFLLEVDYYGRTAVGQTTVPPPPVGVAIESDTLFAPRFGPLRRRSVPGERNTEVTWLNPDELWHFVVIESLEDSVSQIFPDQVLERIQRRFRFVSQPTLDPLFGVSVLMLEDMGEHQVRVYRVNEEYQELYENRTQDSRDLNEPPSNIRNGLGVFSAFNSVVVPFAVVRDPVEPPSG